MLVVLPLISATSVVQDQQQSKPTAAKRPAIFKLVELLRQDGAKRQVFNATLTLEADRLIVAPSSRRNKFNTIVIPYAAITGATIAEGADSSSINWGFGISTTSKGLYLTVQTETETVLLRLESESPLVVAELQSRSGVKVTRYESAVRVVNH